MTNEPQRSIPIANYWGIIRAQVNDRATTAELWDAVRSAASAEGYTQLTGGLAEMNRLRGLSVGVRNAASVFTRARPEAAIESTMFAPDITSRSIPGLSLTPTYRVRYVRTSLDTQGVLQTNYRIESFPLQLPSTKASLLAEMEARAQLDVGKYAEQLVGIGNLEITVV